MREYNICDALARFGVSMEVRESKVVKQSWFEKCMHNSRVSDYCSSTSKKVCDRKGTRSRASRSRLRKKDEEELADQKHGSGSRRSLPFPNATRQELRAA